MSAREYGIEMMSHRGDVRSHGITPAWESVAGGESGAIPLQQLTEARFLAAFCCAVYGPREPSLVCATAAHWLHEYFGYQLALFSFVGTELESVSFRPRSSSRELHDYYNVLPASAAEFIGRRCTFSRTSVGELSVNFPRGLGNLRIVEAKKERHEPSGGFLLSIADCLGSALEKALEHQRLQELSLRDGLTGLLNRRAFEELLEIEEDRRDAPLQSLIMIDIDNFKVLNDTLGHAVGDQLLVEMARRLQTCLRQGDTAARMGGDEFVVILEGLDGGGMAASQAEAVAEKIMAHLRQPFLLDLAAGAQDLPLRNHLCTSSIGIAMFNDQSLSTDELLMRSDTAMYQAKASGRNTVRFFDPDMQSSVDARAALEHDLRHALEQDQLQLYYQPQVDDQDRIMGAEVLLRWLHPERGLVMPGHFIPLAEETGVILALGAWVLENACAQLTRWAQQSAFSHLTISVNVSARQFRQSDFVQQVQTIVQASGANPRLLKLELTESLMVNSVQETVGKMEALHDYGIAFSLDDFGTGYSSLSYLQRLPLDQLKIDQSFVRDLLQDSKDAAIAQTVVNLAQNLGLSVIAEGVETQAQRDFLSDIGCHAYQGYLFGRPCPLQEFEQLFSVAA